MANSESRGHRRTPALTLALGLPAATEDQMTLAIRITIDSIVAGDDPSQRSMISQVPIHVSSTLIHMGTFHEQPLCGRLHLHRSGRSNDVSIEEVADDGVQHTPQPQQK